MKKLLSLLLVVALLLCTLCACGTDNGETPNKDTGKSENVGSFDSDTKADEALFEWEGNLITAITSDGAKKESILIPARCEGFYGVIFLGTNVKHVAFEDDDDVTLDFAFMGADQIVSVKLPNKLSVIPNMGFKGCESLEGITFPADVVSLEGYAFKGCSSLKTVAFEGNKFSVIGENCFENCAALKNITIPEGVTSIEKYAFSDCTALVDVELSTTVKKIAKFAFGNTGIKEIHFPADIQFDVMDTSAFGMVTYEMNVYIVQGSWCDQNQSEWNIGFKEIKYE